VDLAGALDVLLVVPLEKRDAVEVRDVDFDDRGGEVRDAICSRIPAERKARPDIASGRARLARISLN